MIPRIAFPIAAGVLLLALLAWPVTSSAAAARAPIVRPPPIVAGGGIVSTFGPRGSRYHYGIDVGAPTGTPVRVPERGVVAAAYPDGQVSGYGNVITTAHGDHGLLFAHLSSMTVRAGDRVEPGQIIGYVGSTNSEGGFHTSGPHLHWEVIVPTPGSDLLRDMAHYTGSSPPRIDPVEWARARGLAIV